jgi:hypothetical protein
LARAARSGFGKGTRIVGSLVDFAEGAGDGSPAAGDGALLCAHAAQDTSNATTPTHSRRMNFPRSRVHAGAP